MTVLRIWTGTAWEGIPDILADATAGGVAFGTGLRAAYTAAGAENQVLISHGTGPPTWGVVAGDTLPAIDGGTP